MTSSTPTPDPGCAWWKRAGGWIWEQLTESPESFLALVAGAVVFVLALLDVVGQKGVGRVELAVLVAVAFALMRLRAVRTETQEDIQQLEGRVNALIGTVAQLGGAVRAIELASPCRVLRSEIEWKILTPDGKKAICTKKRRVRFDADKVMTLTDLYDPSGKTVSHVCTPGQVIAKPRVKSGQDQYVLIALPKPYRRGEEDEFVITRELRDKFPDPQESATFSATEGADEVILRVVWPKNRQPNQIWTTRNPGGASQKIDLTRLVDEGDGWSLTLNTIWEPPKDLELNIEWTW